MVLLIEDDPNHARALEAMLERVKDFDYVLVHCYNFMMVLKSKKAHNLMLSLNLRLPDSEAITFRS